MLIFGDLCSIVYLEAVSQPVSQRADKQVSLSGWVLATRHPIKNKPIAYRTGNMSFRLHVFYFNILSHRWSVKMSQTIWKQKSKVVVW